MSKLPNLRQATLFYEKYEPREQLGEGISSIVRRCINRQTGKEYAVKIIDLTGSANYTEDTTSTPVTENFNHNDSFCSSIQSSNSTLTDKIDQSILQRVENEVALLKLVRGKPDIIYMVESFQTSAYYFIVFELMNRGELFDYLTAEVTLSENRCRRIMKQIFNALRILHNHNIMHRDVKMENILIDSNLCTKLTDFGLSVQCEKDQIFHDMVGTILYMSPEMLETCMFEDAKGYSFPVDMWACGVIMYTLLSGGKPPFYARKTPRLVRKIMECDYSLDISELEDVSDEAKDLLRGLLCYDVNLRLTANQAFNHIFVKEVNTVYESHENKHRKSDSGVNLDHLDGCHELENLSSRANDLTVHESAIQDQSQCQNLEINQPAMPKPGKKYKFKTVAQAAMFIIKLKNSSQNRFSADSLANLARDKPYDHKSMRHLIDQATYDVYGHWLSRNGCDNSHALLFENSPKIVQEKINLWE